MIDIKKLHHNAYRCIDSEVTRRFYEDFLNLKLIKAFELTSTLTGREIKVLHTFYSLRDKSCLAFFEILNNPLRYKKWHDFDLHIALEVSEKKLLEYYNKGKTIGIETRGISNHGFIKSIYFRDPNGYVIELTVPIKKNVKYQNIDNPHEVLKNWSFNKNV
tara:strand:- start:8844 stop:9326 length:483 start_codon:yes stop_codon:yes gene_type:complete